MGTAAELYELTRIVRSVSEELMELWSRASASSGLTIPEDQVLWAIYFNQPIAASDLIDYLGRHKGTVSKNISKLESLGLVEKAERDDRRYQEITLTPKGERTIRERLMTVDQHWLGTGLLDNIEPDELQTLLSLLRKLNFRPTFKRKEQDIAHHAEMLRSLEAGNTLMDLRKERNRVPHQSPADKALR